MEDKEITVQVPRTVEVPVTKMVPRTVLVPVTVMQAQTISETETRTVQVSFTSCLLCAILRPRRMQKAS